MWSEARSRGPGRGSAGREAGTTPAAACDERSVDSVGASVGPEARRGVHKPFIRSLQGGAPMVFSLGWLKGLSVKLSIDRKQASLAFKLACISLEIRVQWG